MAGTQHLDAPVSQRDQGLNEQSQQMSLFTLGCCLVVTGFRYPPGATGACGKGWEGQGIALSQSL